MLAVWLAVTTVTLCSAAGASRRAAEEVTVRLQVIQRRLPDFRGRIARLSAAGQDTAYPQVTMTVLENFVGYALEDASHDHVWRAVQQADAMEEMVARLDAELTRAEQPGGGLPSPPRWTGDVRARVSGPSFIAPTRTAIDPVRRTRPVFFTGYGHFGQVRADIEKFPGYGVNIIQIEIGPSAILPREGVVDKGPIGDLLAILNRAEKAGVAVNLLISPHYFPDWMLAKYPELRKKRDGFLQYCIHAPEARALLTRFIKILIPPIKDHPALHSICLSNEPVNVEEPCAYAASDWHAWLAKRHGDVGKLNSRWGTSYAAFDRVPLPNPFGSGLPFPVRNDFYRFNQEEFAAFHKLLADSIHAIAPALPVHAKAMTWTLMTSPGAAGFGVDAMLFGAFSQINGNDSDCLYQGGAYEFAERWRTNALSHDLQRSVKDAPVFNSENHIISDRDTSVIPAAHIRAALWQEAIHGQSATTIWVWERSYNPRDDIYGNIMHRPACAEAVGIVGHDLNRAALEVTALQSAPAEVAILTGISPMAWNDRIDNCTNALYTALSFTGLKIGFLTERQLEAGIVTKAKALFVPNIVHLSDCAVETLRRAYRGKIVFVGDENLLSRSDYDRPRPTPAHAASVPFGPTLWSDLRASLSPILAGLQIAPELQLTGASGSPIAGVEWRIARVRGGRVVNLCNYLSKPITCRLAGRGPHGRPAASVDVLTGKSLDGAFELKPMEIRLLRVTDAEARRSGAR
jgi:hypothetical protein